MSTSKVEDLTPERSHSSPRWQRGGPDTPLDTSLAAERVLLTTAHARLEAHYDLDRWHWHDDTPALDICIGCILVQHTAWTNVEHAIDRLRDADALHLEAIDALPEEELALLVRPAGTPLTKARRLKIFATLVLAHGGFESLFALPEAELRPILLATPGIGPETADAILLYGARLPSIVHDAYTARLLGRLGTGPGAARYDVWRAWLDARLPADAAFRRRHHAAIVVHCKALCRVRPKCASCPLHEMCAFAQGATPDPSP